VIVALAGVNAKKRLAGKRNRKPFYLTLEHSFPELIPIGLDLNPV